METSDNASELTREQLQKDLASFIRVRNRLAQTPDSNLSKVFTGLLPRLLRRLDQISLDLYSSQTNNKDVREQMQSQLVGILSHALERIRLLKNNNKTKTTLMPTSAPFCHTLLPLLVELQSTVTVTLALALLEQSLSLCYCYCEDDEKRKSTISSTLIAPLVRAVDQFYNKMRADNATPSSRSHFRTAGWLLLDALALSSGLRALVDWDMHAFEAKRWDELDESVVCADSVAKSAFQLDGAGTLDLLLDVLLFWPPTTQQQQQQARFAPPMEVVDNSTGLSVDGLARMNHRGTSWDEVYLRQLKYVCLHYAVLPMKQGLLSGGDETGSEKASLLAILTSSSNSMHGRTASFYLGQLDSASVMRRDDASGQWVTGMSQCSIALACSLLILVLGDQDARGVLEQHPTERELFESLLGPRPHVASMCRSPLPIQVASRVVDFLRSHFHPTGEELISGQGAIQLYVDLVVAVQDPRRHGVYWGIQLIHGLYNELRKLECKDGWVSEFYRRCLETAKSVLQTLPDDDEYQETPRRPTREELPLGVPEPFGRRSDLNDLLKKHRTAQKKRLLRLEAALTARETAYQMIAELSTEFPADPENGTIPSFSLPAILFKCTTNEEESLQRPLSFALDKLLHLYRQSLLPQNDCSMMSTKHYEAARILPSLLCAACSLSQFARLAAARWSSDLLAGIDPEAALHLLRYLKEDEDSTIAAIANKAIVKLKVTTEGAPLRRGKTDRRFYDSTNEGHILNIKNDLERRIDAIAKEYQLESSVSCMVLHDHNFSVTKAADSLRENLGRVLDSCGLLLRHNQVGAMDVDKRMDLTCGICYEDIDTSDSYALACGHVFCRSCWCAYLDDVFESGGMPVTWSTCPHHECRERLLSSDIQNLDTQLLPKWEDAVLSSFIKKSDSYRLCPGPDCTMVVFQSTASTDAVECQSCSTTFCFECGSAPHQPAKCDSFEQWTRIFQSSSFWVKKNSKPCPVCEVPIEKNQGCNHMRCTQCGTDFCWLCLSPMRTHMEAHTCNRYDPTASAEDDEEHRALFFTERYQAHDEAELFAQDQAKLLQQDGDKVAEKLWFASSNDLDVLLEADETLVTARSFLKYSYVAAWAIRDEVAKREVFESQQAILELVTERLSQLTMANMDHIYHEHGTKGIREHFRSMAFHTSCVVETMQRILSIEHDFSLQNHS